MRDWTFPPPPPDGHYKHLPVGPYVCVLLNFRDELRFSLWRKTASDQHYCHVRHDGLVYDNPELEDGYEDEDEDDPNMQMVPLSAEGFHCLKFAARHIHTEEAWDRIARRAAEQVCQII